MSLPEILAAASRARALVALLEQSDRNADRAQTASGVRHELDAILTTAHALQEETERVAEGNREGKARSDAPETSRAAARGVMPRSGTQRWAVFAELFNAGNDGLTDLEIQQRLRMSPSSERPRRGELVDGGLVESLRKSRTHDGQEWTVWRLTQEGVDYYAKRTQTRRWVVTPMGDPTLF